MKISCVTAGLSNLSRQKAGLLNQQEMEGGCVTIDLSNLSRQEKKIVTESLSFSAILTKIPHLPTILCN